MARDVRRIAAVAVLTLVAACGNSEGGGGTAGSTVPPDGPATTGGPAGEAERDTFVPLEGVPGVTDEAITYAVIGTLSNNLLGTCILDCYVDGIEAYFAFRNSEGGIFGRDLVVGQVLDDALSQNQVRALEVVSADDSFGSFNATLLATGWGDLDAAGIPTYVWGIHATEMAGRQSIFGHLGPLCIDCTGRSVPYAAMLAGATRIASLGYGTTENSKVCAQNQAASVEMYAEDIGAESVYLNDELDYGLPTGIAPEVTTMRQAGVDFISTCLDLNAALTLAQELERQGMGDVPIYHPNTYDQAFVAAAGDLFEGDIVATLARPLESESAGGLADFNEWIAETGGQPSDLSLAGWINAELAFDGLLAAGPEFDRASVIAATNQIDAFTASGMTPPVDWTNGHVPPTEEARLGPVECTSLLEVVDGTFEMVAPPAEPFLCWDNQDRAWADPAPTSFD
jgi:branched-chain amino acid transport system substrate-binding protein